MGKAKTRMRRRSPMRIEEATNFVGQAGSLAQIRHSFGAVIPSFSSCHFFNEYAVASSNTAANASTHASTNAVHSGSG